jgi:phosphodiesterase/alkaline phosphatase D-like protein
LVRRALELTNVTALPQITTGVALGVTTTSAYLSATATGNNLLTTTSFTYGVQPDLSGASITVDAAQVTGATPTAVEVAITNLMPGTTYYYRANATNLAGSVTGAIAQFTTLGGSPAVTTGTASAIASDSAVVTGTVNANTVASQAFFQYSRVADFSTLDGTITAGDVVGSETATLSANLSRLEPGATYFWRIAATNAAGTAVGGTQSFTTPTFKTRTSRTTTALLNALVIDRAGISRALVVPTAKSRLQCAVNSNTKRLTFSRPGTCRVKITITRAGVTTSGNYNLVVR